jgi:hypothetical protein
MSPSGVSPEFADSGGSFISVALSPESGEQAAPDSPPSEGDRKHRDE